MDFKKMVKKIGGFMPLIKNEMTERIREEQLTSTRTRYYLVNGHGPACFCKLRNNWCCQDNSCVNRQAGVACGSKCCGKCCCNNPWSAKKFAIHRKQLTVKAIDGRIGIFAAEVIFAQEMLGEFTGKIIPGDTNMDQNRRRMTLYIPQVNHIVDANDKGSPFRNLAQSHSPNCKAKVMVHEGVYKVVIFALIDIHPNTECSLDFSREYYNLADIPRCYCGSFNCSKRVGYEATHLSELLPPLISDMEIGGSACVQEILSSRIPLIEFDPCHIETHIHGALEPVAVIVPHNSHLRVTRGRILECFLNNSTCYVYKVRCNQNGLGDIYVPALLVFKHVETAMLHLSLFKEDEKTNVITYLSMPPTKQNAHQLHNTMLPNYSNKLLSNNLADFWMERRKYEGSAAIGLPDWILSWASQEQVQDYCLGSSTRTTRQQFRSSHEPPIQENPNINIESMVPMHALGCANKQESPIEESSALSIEDVPCAVSTKYIEYNMNNINNPPLKDILNKDNNVALFQRVINDVIETVVHLMVRRRPKTRPITFDEAYDIVSTEINFYYLDAKDKKSRRFFLFPHYLMGIENEANGSNNLNWCSLCGLHETFENQQQLEHHFHLHHMICATEYSCHKCQCRSIFPSDFVRHVEICTPELIHLLRLDTCPYMMDAFADYLALVTRDGYFRRIIVLGLPTIQKLDSETEVESENQSILASDHCFCPEELLQKVTSQNIPEPTHISTKIIQMDPIGKKPKDESIQVKRTTFKIASRHLYFKEEDKLCYETPAVYQQSLQSNEECLAQTKKSKSRAKTKSRETSRQASTQCSRSSSRVSFNCDEENPRAMFAFNRYGRNRVKSCQTKLENDEHENVDVCQDAIEQEE